EKLQDAMARDKARSACNQDCVHHHSMHLPAKSRQHSRCFIESCLARFPRIVLLGFLERSLQNSFYSGTLDKMAEKNCFVVSFCLAATLLIGIVPHALSQAGPEYGWNEVQVWAGGGHSVPGGTSNTEVFSAGLRYGWVISAEHLPWLLRGRFEYTVDVVPVYLIFQPANTAHGAGFDPLGLKWNFVRRGRFSPFLQLTGGTLFSNVNVPTYTNTVNFTP